MAEKPMTSLSETAEETRTLNLAISKLTGQWLVNDAQRLRAKRTELLKLYRELGRSSFQHTIDYVLANHEGNYFPTVAQIRKAVRSRQEQGTRNFSRNPDCPHCHGSGWIHVRDSKADKLYGHLGHSQVVRCRHSDCLRMSK